MFSRLNLCGAAAIEPPPEATPSSDPVAAARARGAALIRRGQREKKLQMELYIKALDLSRLPGHGATVVDYINISMWNRKKGYLFPQGLPPGEVRNRMVRASAQSVFAFLNELDDETTDKEVISRTMQRFKGLMIDVYPYDRDWDNARQGGIIIHSELNAEGWSVVVQFKDNQWKGILGFDGADGEAELATAPGGHITDRERFSSRAREFAPTDFPEGPEGRLWSLNLDEINRRGKLRLEARKAAEQAAAQGIAKQLQPLLSEQEGPPRDGDYMKGLVLDRPEELHGF